MSRLGNVSHLHQLVVVELLVAMVVALVADTAMAAATVAAMEVA